MQPEPLRASSAVSPPAPGGPFDGTQGRPEQRRTGGRSRLGELDILRGLAVLMVVWHHAGHFEDATRFFPRAVWRLIFYSQRGGWCGVDLFFVLSGFLVAGLLFGEYLHRKDIDYPRFFVRRGLKIYPAFYALLAVAVIVHFFSPQAFQWSGLLHEAVYLQNYFKGLWGHTWTLAVEEHFYLSLPIIFLIARAFRKPGSPHPFRALPAIFGVVAVTCLVVRICEVAKRVGTPEMAGVFMTTHTRLDSLLFGACLSLLWHFNKEDVQRFLLRGRSIQVAVALFLVVLPYAPGVTNVYNYTIGFTFNYIGWGLLMLHLIVWQGTVKDKLIGHSRWLQYVGRHSYSIYLWHTPLLLGLCLFLPPLDRLSAAQYAVAVSAYLAAAIGLGILLSIVIEFPVLKLRDRIFPSRSGAVT